MYTLCIRRLLKVERKKKRIGVALYPILEKVARFASREILDNGENLSQFIQDAVIEKLERHVVRVQINCADKEEDGFIRSDEVDARRKFYLGEYRIVVNRPKLDAWEPKPKKWRSVS